MPVTDRGARHRSAVRWIFVGLSCVALALVAISCVTQLGGPLDPNRRNLHIILFDVSVEANIPTWFSTALWFLAALACLSCAYIAMKRRGQWLLLGLFCLAFSLDEATSMHDQILGEYGAMMLGDDRPSVYRWVWVVPGAIVALVIAAGCLRLIWSLPRTQRWLVIVSGVIFVTGALGVETLTHMVQTDEDQTAFILLNGLEEGLEMLGVILFLCAILSLLRVRRSGDHVEVSMDAGSPRGGRDESQADSAATGASGQEAHSATTV